MPRSLIIANKHGAVIVNSATQNAYPPVFTDEAAAQSFLEFCGRDPSEFLPESVLVLFSEWKRQVGNEGARNAIDLHLVPVGAGNGRKRIGRD